MKNKIIKLILILSIILIIIDQASKAIIKLNYKEPIEGNIMTIYLMQNEGLAFGMNDGNNKNIALTTIILIMLINFVIRQKENVTILNAISISLIFAGGISNLIDRVFRGGVVDFIKVTKFAVFNIADCYIVCGWIMLVFFLIKEIIPNSSKKNKNIEVEDCKKN